MAVAFRSVSTAGAGFVADSQTTTKPAGTASGDALLLNLFSDQQVTITPPSGSWTQLELTDWNGWRSYTWWLLAGGSEPADYTCTWSGTIYVDILLSAYSGVDAAGPIIDSTANSGSGTTATGTGITVPSGRDGSMLAWHAISSVGARSGAPTPGSWTNRSTFDTNDYLDTLPVDAGATGDFTSTYTSQAWVVHLVGLQPAASGGGGGAVTVNHSSVLSFPTLCRKPQNDNGRWIRGRGGLWEPRRAA